MTGPTPLVLLPISGNHGDIGRWFGDSQHPFTAQMEYYDGFDALCQEKWWTGVRIPIQMQNIYMHDVCFCMAINTNTSHLPGCAAICELHVTLVTGLCFTVYAISPIIIKLHTIKNQDVTIFKVIDQFKVKGSSSNFTPSSIKMSRFSRSLINSRSKDVHILTGCSMLHYPSLLCFARQDQLNFVCE